jgi:hypothetical protein
VRAYAPTVGLFDGFMPECERQLSPLLATHGFEYAGAESFGRGCWCSWLLLPERMVHLKVWAEYDGSLLLYAVVSLEELGKRVRVSRCSMYVGVFNRERLGDDAPVHTQVLGSGVDGYRHAVMQVGSQLGTALPHLPEMIKALELRDEDVRMR